MEFQDQSQNGARHTSNFNNNDVIGYILCLLVVIFISSLLFYPYLHITCQCLDSVSQVIQDHILATQPFPANEIDSH